MVLMQTSLEPAICLRYLSGGLLTFFHPNLRWLGIQSNSSELMIFKALNTEGWILDGAIYHD